MNTPHDIVIAPTSEGYSARSLWDSHEIATGPSASAVIQAAIDQLNGLGGEVHLRRGEYLLTEPVRLAPRVLFRGSGRGTRLIVAGEHGIVATDVRGPVVADLALESQKMHTAANGIIFDGIGEGRIRDVHCQDFREAGLLVRNHSFLCDLSGCRAANNAGAGIRFHNIERGSHMGAFPPNLVNNCMAYGGGKGFECDRALLVDFTGCLATHTSGSGFHIHNVSNSILISGCRTFKNFGDAVRVEQSHEFNASSNIFCWHRGRGIVLDDVSWGVICGNEIIDSGSEMTGGEAAIGIDLRGQSRAIQITGNTIFNWGGQGLLSYGIREAATCTNNAIAENNFNFYEHADIESAGTGTRVGPRVSQKEPAYHGDPAGPDPRFSDEPLLAWLSDKPLPPGGLRDH